MKKPVKAIVTKERTVHTYSELWHASRCVLEVGMREPRGSSWQFLSSVVLTAFAFEACLNHVGPTVITSWAELERHPPWKKFELLCETLKVRFPYGFGRRPLQTIATLLDFRNTMAHGRSGDLKSKPALRDANEKLDADLGEMPLMDWERLIQTDKFARLAREDVKVALEILHAARPNPKEGLFTFGLESHSAKVAPSKY
jgi:hypothetical protein